MAFELIETTLGSVCASQGGSVSTGPFGSQLHASDYSDVGTPVVMPVNLVGGRVSETGIARVSNEHVTRLGRHRLSPGDIVFSRRGDVTRFALVSERERGWLCGTGCLKISLGDPLLATPEFIAAYLSSPDAKEWLVRHAVGATMPNLNTEILSDVPITLPPLTDQFEIGAFLAAIDHRIDLLRQTNATLEAIAQALFKSWFVDFDPVRAKAEGRAPEGMDAETATLFPSQFEESELGLIPSGWRAIKVGNIADLIKGCSYKGAGLSESEGASMFNLGCFNAKRVFATENIKRYTGQYRDRQSVVEGDLIMANTDMTQQREILGRALFVPANHAPAFVSHHVFKIAVNRANADEWKRFLFFAFQQPAFRERAVGHATGTTVLALARDSAVACPILEPSDKVHRAFDAAIAPLLAQIANNLDQAKSLEGLRDTLLPRLISGKLRLPEAQAIAEEASA